MTNDSVTYIRHRDLTVAVSRTDGDSTIVGDFHAGVAEWGLETGASLRTSDMAAEFARKAIDRHLDTGADPAACLALSGAEPIPLTKGLLVETAYGTVKVFYNATPEDEEDDPYLTETGWYQQPMNCDDPPEGPYGTHQEAAEAAMVQGASPKA